MCKKVNMTIPKIGSVHSLVDHWVPKDFAFYSEILTYNITSSIPVDKEIQLNQTSPCLVEIKISTDSKESN